MVGYVKSYGGRPDPKPGKKLSDCVIRALCELTGIDWYEEHVVNLQSVQETKLGFLGRVARTGVHPHVYYPYFESQGLKRIKLPRGPKPTITEAHARYGNCIIRTNKHVFAVIDGNVRDTWDCRKARALSFDPYDRTVSVVSIQERKAITLWVPADSESA